MGIYIQRGLRNGKVGLLVFILMLVPLRSTSSYNMFFKEYDFTFPKNDVLYQPEFGTVFTQNYIRLPSMDIIRASIRLNELNWLFVQMNFAGKPYTNFTTAYRFDASFYVNSTNEITIGIHNSLNSTNNNIFTSVNQSTYMIYDWGIRKDIYGNIPESLLNHSIGYTEPIISSNAITWVLDLNNVSSIIPLSQIFTGANFSDQTQIKYQNDLSFYFGVRNTGDAGYEMYIHNDYSIDHVGTPPPVNYSGYLIFGIILLSVICYTIYRSIYRRIQSAKKGHTRPKDELTKIEKMTFLIRKK